MMIKLTPGLIVILAAGCAALIWWGLWLVLYFYRRYQIGRLFEESSTYPNQLSRFALIDGVKLHYLVEGEGPDLILIHGLAANVYTWRHLMPLLSKRFKVWALDLKGFGVSDKPRKSDYSIKAQAEHVLSFMKAQGIRSAVMVGSSLGGAVAGEISVLNPGAIRKLVLLDSVHDPEIFKLDVAHMRRLLKLVSPLVPFFSPLVNREAIKPYLRLIYGSRHQYTDEDVNAYLMPYMQSSASHMAFLSAFKCLMDHTLATEIRQSQVPVLILWGEEDKLVPLRFGEKIHREIPRSQFFTLPHAGHHIQEEDPEWVAQKILAFT
jgi:pimeloyl-ACP methyl ester carboxylesterase